MPLNCVDASNYTGELGADALAAWKAIGVELVLVQAIAPPPGYPPEVDQQQAQAVLDAGLKLGVYVFHWTGTDLGRQNAARFAGYGFPVERWWADFEDKTNADPTEREREVGDLLVSLDALGGKRPAGGYSGNWWTGGYLPAGSRVFAGRAIWVAQYDGVDTPAAEALCGGTPTVHQYVGTVTLRGVPNVDLDAADPAEFTDPEPTPTRETPDGVPWPTWREYAINEQGIADALGQQRDALTAQVASLTQQLANKPTDDTWQAVVATKENTIRQMVALANAIDTTTTQIREAAGAAL